MQFVVGEPLFRHEEPRVARLGRPPVEPAAKQVAVLGREQPHPDRRAVPEDDALDVVGREEASHAGTIMSMMWRWLLVIAACGGPRDPLLAIRGDRTAMRAHGWHTWARVAGAWDAWAPTERLFGSAPPARPRFRTPRPFLDGDRLETETLPVMFDVLFDPTAAAHIRAHRLGRRGELAQLAAFPAFPTSAVAVKLVWYPIHAIGTTTLPIWDGEPPEPHGNPDRSWHRTIKVGTGAIPLDAFIHRELADDELDSARAASRDPTLARGDSVVLIAAHVTTKEIPDWTWETFWWHDQPDDDQPDDVRGAARHYRMDVAFVADAPCFNPWLEARFPDGQQSNCVACHRRAVVAATDYLPVTHGRLRDDDAYFAGHVPTDFVWSIALEAR